MVLLDRAGLLRPGAPGGVRHLCLADLGGLARSAGARAPPAPAGRAAAALSAQVVPLVLFQLFGGVLADRTDRLRLLLGTQILTALALTVAFILTVLGLVRLPQLTV